MDILETIITITLVIFGSGSIVVVYIQYRYQKLQAVQEKLREERRKIYIDLLSPLILAFTKPPDIDKMKQQISSFEYRKTGFELILLGSDDVIRAHAELMKFFFQQDYQKNFGVDKSIQAIKLFGALLIEIRKDLGNDKTTLNVKDIMTQFITDIDKIKI